MVDINLSKQYGDYIVVKGHNLSIRIIGKANKIIDEQIQPFVDKGFKIKRWSEKVWLYEFEDEDAPDGKGFIFENVKKILDLKGKPVTLFIWKTKVNNKWQ